MHGIWLDDECKPHTDVQKVITEPYIQPYISFNHSTLKQMSCASDMTAEDP